MNSNIDENNVGISSVKFGKNVKIIKPVNLYNCTIGDNSMIGPFVEIQSNVFIGNNTRIQSHSFLCKLVRIGNNCFVGHGVFFTNDLLKEGKRSYGDISKWKKTIISDNVLIGSNSTILPVRICEGVVIGAGSVVTKDINIKGTYAGNPAKLLNKL